MRGTARQIGIAGDAISRGPSAGTPATEPVWPRAALVLILCLSAPAAFARDAHTARAVHSVGEEATKAFEDGDFGRAAELYMNAWQLAPEAKYLYGAARCAHMAGHHEEAMTRYRRFLAANGADDRRVANAKRYMDEITADKLETLLHDANKVARDSPELAAEIYLEAYALDAKRLDLLFKAAVTEQLSGELTLARDHLRQYLAAAEADAPDRSHALARLKLLDRKLEGTGHANAPEADGPTSPSQPAIVCPPGMQALGKKCVPQANCPEGLVWNGKACVAVQAICIGESGKTCRETGSAYYHGRGIAISFPTAAQWFQRACDSGDPVGCTSLGIAYANGKGVPQDLVKASELYAKACDAQDAPACYNLGVRYERGIGVTRNLARAAHLYQVACGDGDGRACYNLGVFHYTGQSVPRNLALAAELFQRACDGDDSIGCYNLGVVYMRGDGVAQDLASAAKWFQRACDSDDAGACTWLGKLYRTGQGVQPDPARAAELQRHACDRGSAAGCRILGENYATGEGVVRDAAKAAQFYSQACESGDMAACADLGETWCKDRASPDDVKNGAALLKKACDRGLKRACETLASPLCK